MYTPRVTTADYILAARTWTGHFPGGSMISGFRCLNPITEEKDGFSLVATCECSQGLCAWSKDLPVCSNKGLGPFFSKSAW